MANSLKIFLLLPFICFYLQDCANKQNPETNSVQKTESTFSRYPVIPDSLKYLNNSLIEPRDKLFNLPSLYNGINDSLEIRICPLQHLSYDERVFDLKICNDSFHSGWVYYSNKQVQPMDDGSNIDPSGNTSTEKIAFQCRQVVPLCGWKAFYDSVNKFGIMQLPTQDSIKINPHIGGVLGRVYIIEFATKNSYRQIKYYDFGANETHEECFRLLKFINFLQSQFREDYWWPLPTD